MKAVLLTREYPPDVYGGAGVHVEYLARELAKLIEVEVRCFGEPRTGARAFRSWEALADANAALQTVSVDLAMAAERSGADVVHSHTWYTNLGGHLAKLLHTVPHVMTTHSLEPKRPWKVAQLGAGGYALSSFCERTAIEAADAVVAVSHAMRDDIRDAYPEVDETRIDVISNGIDTNEYAPDLRPDALVRHGVALDVPIVLFVGRVTRQKGIVHLLDAALELDGAAQLVFAAGAADEPEVERATRERVERLRARRDGVVWIEEMLPKRDVIQLLSHAVVFCVPSIYEPLGIVNLEAMACETAVVASAVGGIPEVVVDGETGLLVPVALDADGDPADPSRFAAGLARRIDELLADPNRARRLGEAGRRRAVEQFSWSAVAQRTTALYERPRPLEVLPRACDNSPPAGPPAADGGGTTMHRTTWKRPMVVVGAVAIVAAVATVSASGGSRAAATAAATLTVTGSGSVTYTPDTATLTFGASSQRKTAVAATAANATVMNAVLAALQHAGAQQISTNQLSVGPSYTPSSAVIVGFTATNSVQASTSVDRIGALMDTAVAAGATSIQGPSFSTSKDESVLYRSALRAAVGQARAQAQVLADDAGVTLGPLVSVNPSSYVPTVTAVPAATSPTTPVIPPTQSVSAGVTLVFSVS